MTTEPPIPFSPLTTVAVVGVGLVGGSVAAAIKSRGHQGPVFGVGRDSARLKAAVERGLLDGFATDPAQLDADLWVVCTPVDRVVEDVRRIAKTAQPGTLVTDAGSVKGPICRELADLWDGVVFVGSHPLAGSEKRGFEHAKADLFQDRLCVLTPTERTDEDVLLSVVGFWQFLGMRVVRTTPEAHDAAVAMTSHLPHVVAAALAGSLRDDEFPLTATGFADTTRVAAGDPDLWTAILTQNADAVAAGLARFETELRRYREAVQSGDSTVLRELLQDARTKRLRHDG